MTTKLIIKEGYNGNTIGECPMNPNLTIKEILINLPSEIMLSLSDDKQLKYLEEVDIREDEITLSIGVDKFNWFECFCILEKICDEIGKLNKKFNKEVLINDYKRRSEDVIFIEVDSTIPYCVVCIPTEKGKRIGELFEIALDIEILITKIVTDVLSFSKNVNSYPKPPNPYITTKLKLFISHSSKDKPVVKKLVDDLKTKSFDIWYDEDNILVGQDFVEQIQRGIRESDFLVLVMSKNFIDFGPWAKEEYKIALTDQISKNITKILPIMIEDCNVPDFLKAKHYADFREDYDYGLNKLINSAAKLAKRK